MPLVSRRLGIPERHIRFIPFGVDTSFFAPTAETVSWDVVSVGTNEGKDFPTLIAALSPSMRCLIVTDTQNQQQVLNTPTEATVEIDHDVPITRLRTLYASGSCHVVPLRNVPISSGQTVLLENLAMGNAVIVSDTVATRDYVSREVATLVPPGDVSAMREALSTVPARPIDAAVEHVREHFTSERFATDLAALCVEIVASDLPRNLGTGLPEFDDPSSERQGGTDRRGGTRRTADASEPELSELVVCSLESWDEIWRRNQFFVDALLRRNPGLRVLFIEPPADVLFDLAQRRRPALPRLRKLATDDRLKAFRPLKPVPRKLGGLADEVLRQQARLAARLVGFSRPLLWINDVTYAPLIERTGWPSLYDVTDDWLLAPFPPREIDRLRRLEALALARADEVVVCSAALAESRGKTRLVSLVPNGVDVMHFRRPRPRPSDLPAAPTAVYVGSLHDARLDVELVGELADALPELSVVLVGPDSLSGESHEVLANFANVHLLGARPYEDVPAYLQHADVVIVPHRVSPFTESLDPIKAYECLAITRPTVATPVAGFREHAEALHVVRREDFTQVVAEVMFSPPSRDNRVEPVDWDARSRAFEEVLLQATLRDRSQAPDVGE
jgi:glycosyltransferase involved in cell wall biosynthesis